MYLGVEPIMQKDVNYKENGKLYIKEWRTKECHSD
jgi:hypothetical protein